jgi:hypothetical protein
MSSSRAARHELKEFFGGPVQTWASSFSGAMSLANPSAGNHLRVFKVYASAPSGNANTVGFELRDGADLKALLYVPAGTTVEFGCDGRYLQFDTAVRVTRADNSDTLAVTFQYREHKDV